MYVYAQSDPLEAVKITSAMNWYSQIVESLI